MSRLDIHIDTIRTRYEAGEPDAKIAADYDCHTSSIRNFRLRHGIATRTTWSRNPTSSGLQKLTILQNDQLKIKYEAGATLEDLMVEYDVALVTIRKRLLELGVAMREAGPARVQTAGSLVKCGCCDKFKDRSDFDIHPTNGTGLFTNCKLCETDRQRKRLYGSSNADYDRRFAEQGGVCKVCGSPPDSVRNQYRASLVIDHDHNAPHGRGVRGLICTSCNSSLGLMSDDLDKIEGLKEYLIKNKPI